MIAPANIVLSSFWSFLGDSSSLALTLTDPDTGAPFDPTGSVLLFTMKVNALDPDSAAVVQKISTVGGFTVVSAPQGRVNLALVPADYAGLKSLKTYQIDVQAQNTLTGAIKTVLRGTFVAEIDVTRLATLSIPTNTTNTAPNSVSFFNAVLAGIASVASDTTKLCGLQTLGSPLTVGSVVRASFPGNVVAEFQLETNTGAAPGFLFEPFDYDPVANPVQWRLQRISRLGSPCSWNADTSKWHDLYAVGTAGAVSLGVDQTGFSLPA